MLNVKEKLTKDDILGIFKKGCKSEQSVGIEYERLPICANKYNAVDYYDGICEFLREFAREENWDYITDDFNIIGLKQEHSTITLEPGCQIELSVKPEKTIFELKSKVDYLDKKIKPILDKHGIELLPYGVSPLSTYNNINLIPKRRYHIMAHYMWGFLADVMMRETAGIQGCFDFEDEQDAIRKFRLANKMTPFMTAMFANSPIRGGVETGYKSFRALSWLNTDNDRCGFAFDLDEDFSFEKYISQVLKTPMIFINKDNTNIEINGRMTFDEYMNNGFDGYEATLDDFELQANLYFPEVRLRNFIEVRNHDCSHLQYSILAIYKGIFYNQNAMAEVESLLGRYSNKDFEELRYEVPKYAISARIGSHSVCDIAKEIIKIAEISLIEMQTGEESFLEPIKELVYSNLCPADIILRNWNGIWNKDISRLVKYLKDITRLEI